MIRSIWNKVMICAALVTGAACFFAQPVLAGSCCGGGQATTLVLPKMATSMVDVAFDREKYDGFWTQDGKYLRDQPGTDLNQYRLNFGYAFRLAPRWQASVAVPYIWNDNKYSGLTSHSDGPGDSTLSLWYEAFDSVMCRWGWASLELADLKPAATFGLSVTVPTGISPYDNVKSSFDITGRGFYRVDGNVLLDKTIYPVSASIFLSYGTYIERPVNREYGQYVEPYRKKLGDRMAGTFALSYETLYNSGQSRNRLAFTAAFSGIREADGTINGSKDPTTGFRKSSVTGTIAWSTLTRTWTVKLSWNHSIKEDGWGKNFPASDIYSVGVTHVFY